MAFATYKVIPQKDGWTIDHDGALEGQYETKEAAFESIWGAASNSMRDGLGIRIEIPERNLAGEAV